MSKISQIYSREKKFQKFPNFYWIKYEITYVLWSQQVTPPASNLGSGSSLIFVTPGLNSGLQNPGFITPGSE
jgi:hypothetical protein